MSELHDANTPSGENPNEVTDGLSGSQGAAPTPNWKEFIDGLDKLNGSLGQKLDRIGQTVTESTKPPAPPPPDFDQMSQTELVAHVTGSVQSMVQNAIQEALRPITDQLAGVQNDIVSTRGEMSIKEMRAAHKDLSDWKDDMIGLVGKHPTLSLQEVYNLAKALNPDKAKALDLKYNPPPPKPRPFGGLAPSGNGKASEPILTGMDATKAAYNEVMARHPGILPMLQDL